MQTEVTLENEQKRNPGAAIDPVPPQLWTIMSLLEWASGYLARRGFDEARLHVELMLAHILNLKRLDLYLQFDRPLTPEERGAFRALFERRLKHEPLQYILGHTEFMGLSLAVDRSVLIPRPETELLVERAVEIFKAHGPRPAEVLEIGTGSGNIAVALGMMLPGVAIVSIDISADALKIAAANVARHDLANVTLVQGDVFGDFLSGRTFDLLLSNPPYVSREEFLALDPEVREHEPPSAVTDNADGMKVISRIATIAPLRLRPGGVLLMELGYGQSERVCDLLASSGMVSVELIADFAHIPRVVQARRPLQGERSASP
jgi:release factor glutamine methyltransferase